MSCTMEKRDQQGQVGPSGACGQISNGMTPLHTPSNDDLSVRKREKKKSL